MDIIRQTAGRGGKTVTVVKGFVGIGLPEKEQLAKAMQKACGTGGTVKNGQIEIQGDKRAEVSHSCLGGGLCVWRRVRGLAGCGRPPAGERTGETA